MALAQYIDRFWFPSGALAAGVSVRVFPLNSNVLAPLFSDIAGTIPIGNPLTTNAVGVFSFCAEAGEYWVQADSASFRISVGLPAVTPGEIADIQADIIALQSDVAALETNVTGLDGEVTALQGAVTTVQADIAALESDVLTLQGSMSAVEGDVSVLQGNVTTLQGQMTAVESDVSTLQTDVGTLQLDVSALQAAVAVVQSDVLILQSDVTTLQTDVGVLQSDVDAVEVDVASLQVDVSTLQTDVTALQGDVSTLQSDMTTAQSDIASLQVDVAALSTRLDAVESIAFATISTGITAGGELNANLITPSSLDIGPFEGYFTDFATDPFNPVVTRIVYAGSTVPMDAGSLARTATAWLMAPDQSIIQQATPPTNSQRRTHIFLGVTAQVAGVIIVDQSLPVILQQPADQLLDLMTSLGAFNISGNRITPNGVNLSINQTSGEVFSQAFNHFAGPVQTNDPHVSTTTAQTPAQVRYVTSTSTTFGLVTPLLDIANFDVGGVVTPVGGGANSATIQRVYLFPNNTAAEQIVIQYGMTAYTSLANAVAAIGAGTSFVPNPLTRAAALLGHIAVIRTAVNLSDPTQAAFTTAGKFSTP